MILNKNGYRYESLCINYIQRLFLFQCDGSKFVAFKNHFLERFAH